MYRENDNNNNNNNEEVEKKNFNCNYCKLLPVDCWRHCLKEVRIHKFDGNRVCLVLMKDYFYREVENLEFLFKEMDSVSNNNFLDWMTRLILYQGICQFFFSKIGACV